MRLKLIRTIQRARVSGRKVAANLTGRTSSLEAPDEGVGEFGSPQLGPFGGVISDTNGLMSFHQRSHYRRAACDVGAPQTCSD
jgi:hypothetical protein